MGIHMNAELDLCHAVVELHSRPSFPSLNLAHAVACVAYELARPVESSHPEGEEIDQGVKVSQVQGVQLRTQPSGQTNVQPLPTPMTFAREDEAFLRRVMEVSERVSYPPGRSPERFARRLRALLRRAQATPGDYGMILGLMREIDRLNMCDAQAPLSVSDTPTISSSTLSFLPSPHNPELDDV